MERYRKLFRQFPSVIGMIHLLPLQGTPKYISGSFKHVLDMAKHEAELYVEAGVDGILIENMNDLPFVNRNVGPEITSAMTAVAVAVKSVAPNIPCGIQILAGCNKEALAVAHASGCEFIRAEGYLFSHISDEGIMHADAGELLRYRKSIDADDILVFTDVKKKHCSHAITNDIAINEVCKAAELFLSDAVIITGTSTGSPACHTQVMEAKQACTLPIIIGSGITLENISHYKHADGYIVGSYFKDDGYWGNQISKKHLNNFMIGVNKLQSLNISSHGCN